MSEHNSSMRSVPAVFKFIASVSDASKFNVAAPWKTIDTSDISLSFISCVIPSPSRPTSPQTTCSLDNSDLFVFLMESNNYRRNIELFYNTGLIYSIIHLCIIDNILTGAFMISWYRKRADLPLFDLINTKMFFIPGQLYNSFQTSTFPMRPVLPVTNTDRSLKNWDITLFSILDSTYIIKRIIT